MIKRNMSGNYAYLQKVKDIQSDKNDQGRKYSVFSEESSSLSGDFETEMSMQSESGMRNNKFQYPLCLSSIILRLSDILLYP